MFQTGGEEITVDDAEDKCNDVIKPLIGTIPKDIVEFVLDSCRTDLVVNICSLII